MPLLQDGLDDIHAVPMSDRIAFIGVLVLIAAVMYWRIGLALPDSLIAQWVIIGIAGYILGRGWIPIV